MRAWFVAATAVLLLVAGAAATAVSRPNFLIFIAEYD